MIEIGKTIVSFDIVEEQFVCDLSVCKGICCVHGDSGAPLDTKEATEIERQLERIIPFMQGSGIETVEKVGIAVTDSDGDLVTPLIDGKECAFAFFENGEAKCAIEKAWIEKKVTFRKPASCWLYPIRIAQYKDFEALNYHRWDICKCGIAKGKKMKIPLYIFLKEPLEHKFGEDWYKELEKAAVVYRDTRPDRL